MRRLLLLSLSLIVALAALSCSKKSSGSKNTFEGIWYITTISEIGDGENITEGTGNEYWEFKKNGTVIVNDTTVPELGGGSTPKRFSYEEGTRTLMVDAFAYEVLVANSSELRLRSRFSPEVWDRDTYLVISFQRTKKGL